MKKANAPSQLATDTPVTETQVVSYTQTVDVTDASGEQVTDASGEAVTSVITVTQIHTYVPTPVQTTEEKGFFDKLFDNNKGTTADNTSAGDKTPQTTPETTEKQGFFDKLFGKDETTTTTKAPSAFADVVTTQKSNSSTNTGSTVQPATTKKPVTTEKDFSARFAGEGITPSLISDFQSFVFSYYTKAGYYHTSDHNAKAHNNRSSHYRTAHNRAELILFRVCSL